MLLLEALLQNGQSYPAVGFRTFHICHPFHWLVDERRRSMVYPISVVVWRDYIGILAADAAQAS